MRRGTRATTERRSAASAPRRFDAVLFDNDGILVDTEPLFLQATQEVLATVGVALRAQDYHEITMRRGQTVFDLASAKGVTDHEILNLRARRGRRYSELIAEGVKVLPGVRDTLPNVADSFRTAIVTSSDRGHFEQIHAQTGLLAHFEFVLADGDYGRHKPYPDPYERAAERMTLSPDRCLVVEDTERGLDAAVAAGMTCVVIPTALTRTGNYSRADAVLGSMNELVAYLSCYATGE